MHKCRVRGEDKEGGKESALILQAIIQWFTHWGNQNIVCGDAHVTTCTKQEIESESERQEVKETGRRPSEPCRLGERHR